MKTIAKPLSALVLLAGMGLASTAEAALFARLGGLAVYDQDRNITWLANANYAQTSGYDTDGGMTWQTAKTWAEGLNIGGYTGWRLPTTLQPDATCQSQSGGDSYGYNCTGSELGHLFYNELGGAAGSSIGTVHNTNYDLFTNVKSSVYWSGTEYAPLPFYAWLFSTFIGDQYGDVKDVSYYAWAVRSGDVAAVPEPGVMGLLGVGALAWAGAKARRRG